MAIAGRFAAAAAPHASGPVQICADAPAQISSKRQDAAKNEKPAHGAHGC